MVLIVTSTYPAPPVKGPGMPGALTISYNYFQFTLFLSPELVEEKAISSFSVRTKLVQPISPPLQLQEKDAPSHSLHKLLFHQSSRTIDFV